MIVPHCPSEGNRQLFIATIRRFYRYTLRNFFLGQTCDMHVLLHCHASHERIWKSVSNKAERLPHEEKEYLKNRYRKCIGKVRKIVSCRFCSYFADTVVALLIATDYRINQQKLSVRSLPLSIIYAVFSFVVYYIWHNWYNYIIYSLNNIPNNIHNKRLDDTNCEKN